MDRATSQQNNSACAGAQKASIDSSGLNLNGLPQFFELVELLGEFVSRKTRSKGS